MMYTVFLPCRAGSTRVPKKNTRPFASQPDGLLGLKLRQLLGCQKIARVILSTNDDVVKGLAEPYVVTAGGRLQVFDRPDHLSSSETILEDLIKYVPSLIDKGEVIWTHVTSPFFEADDYDNAIEVHQSSIKYGYDSLMGVNTIKTFLWDKYGPMNYDRKKTKWPSTQSLSPLYEINSTIFICSIDNIIKTGDRIGSNPYLYEVPKSRSFDVDWEEDFAAAAELWELRNQRGNRYGSFGSE